MGEGFEQALKKIKELLQEKARLEQVIERAYQEKKSVKEEILRRVMKEYLQKWHNVGKRAQPVIGELNGKLGEIEDNKKKLEAAKLGIEERAEEIEFRLRIGDLDEDEYRQRRQQATDETESLKTEFDDLEKEAADYRRAIEALQQPMSGEMQNFFKEIIGDELGAENSQAIEADREHLRTLSASISMINPEVVFTPRNAYVEIVSKGSKSALVPPVVTIGRAKDNHIVIDDTRVSRYHGRFEIEGDFDRVIYRDLGSKDGSFLNERKVVEAELKDGDRLFLGNTELLIKVE